MKNKQPRPAEAGGNFENSAAVEGRLRRLVVGCPNCEGWRAKWHEARRYLRAANRGAETNALALQVSVQGRSKLSEQLTESRRAHERTFTALRNLRMEVDAAIDNIDTGAMTPEDVADYLRGVLAIHSGHVKVSREAGEKGARNAE